MNIFHPKKSEVLSILLMFFTQKKIKKFNIQQN